MQLIGPHRRERKGPVGPLGVLTSSNARHRWGTRRDVRSQTRPPAAKPSPHARLGPWDSAPAAWSGGRCSGTLMTSPISTEDSPSFSRLAWIRSALHDPMAASLVARPRRGQEGGQRRYGWPRSDRGQREEQRHVRWHAGPTEHTRSPRAWRHPSGRASPSTTSAPSAVSTCGGATTLQARLPPPSTMRSRPSTAASR